jgi:nicotinamide-nucleotide amidase
LRAEILAIGSELLDPDRSDTNGPFLAERLRSVGIEVMARSIVGDEREWLEPAFRTALARADVVITTGGLGPTEDDRTREAVAAALGRALVRDADVTEALRARFARFGWKMALNNARQADLVTGAEWLANPNGTAPGQWIEDGERLVILLPGPPGEMRPLVEADVLPRLCQRAGGKVVRSRVLRLAAVSESEIDGLVGPLYSRIANPRTTILSAAGELELRFRASGATEAEAEGRIEELVSEVRRVLGDRIASEDGSSMEEVVARLLTERGQTLALAESCTGGLLAGRLTAVAGASVFLHSAIVTYSNAAKTALIGVDADLIAQKGAVSKEVARAMARGVRERAGTDIGLGITGIAGPGGGTAEKPLGLVLIALAGSAGESVRRSIFPGDRTKVRARTVALALEMLRRGLLGLPQL